jgi:uncharacterized protein
MSTGPDPQPLAGIGLKDEHVAALLAAEPGSAAVGFVEVHAENLMVAGGPRPRALARLRAERPLSLHGVGLSIGGAEPLSQAHLARLAVLVERYEPRWFSEHLAWSSHGGVFFNDLLPLPYHRGTLQQVCAHVQQVQERLRRPLLLENPSTYLGFESSTMDEPAFLAEVLRRTGCGLLLDLNNAWVSAANHGLDARAFVDALLDAVPAGRVGEIHLAGHDVQHDGAGAPLLIDTHGQPVAEGVWSLYRHTLARLGPVPTLIERDQALPPLPVLAAEAGRALALQQAVVTEAAA